MENFKDIKERFKNTETFLNEFNKSIDSSFKIKGGDKNLSIKEWRRYFYIKVPIDVSFQGLIDTSVSLMRKYQEACNYRDQSLAQLSVFEQIKDEKYHSAFQEARRENERKFNKPLAAESCKTAAKLAIQELEDPLVYQKAIKDFWDKTCSMLIEVRKLIELMLRALSGDSYLQREINIKG